MQKTNNKEHVKNLLISGNIKEKIKWYIKAHGHSSMGGLNLIWTYFDFNNKKETADIIDKAIKLFENFTGVEELNKQLKELDTSIINIEKTVCKENIDDGKKEEMLEILNGVKKNVIMLDKILQNPGYEEKLMLSKILFSTAVQLLKQYPDMLHGDLVGDKGADVGNRIKLTVKESIEEKEILCCGYEIQLLLFNLLSNAVDAIEDKGNIYIEIVYEKDLVKITVCDDGKLLSEGDIEKIKQHKEYSTKGKDHGKGIKIIYDILEKYHGNLDIRTKEELVSFTARIPLKTE